MTYPREEAAKKAWEKEQKIYEELGLPVRPYPAGMVEWQFPDVIYNREILEGIAKGIEPEKKGYLFDFFKGEVQKTYKDIDNFKKLIMQRHDLTEQGYKMTKLPADEHKMAVELADNVRELLRAMGAMQYRPRQIELFRDEKEVYRFSKHLHPAEE